MPLTNSERVVKERTLAKYSATIVDEDNAAIAADDLDTLTLTLFGPDGSIINGREQQNVLGQNNVSVSAAGVLTWLIQPLDNVILGSVPTGHFEKHFALFEWTYAGTKSGKYLVQINVMQLPKVPAA